MKTKKDQAEQMERLLSALLVPTVEVMRNAGIARLGIERDQSVLLQMTDGSVVGPINVRAAFQKDFQ